METTLKPLNQADFKMLIIKDLGIKNYSTYNRRTAIFRCCNCKEDFNTKVSVSTKNQTKCKKCNKPPTITKHGKSHLKIYKVWTAMKQRCTNPKEKRFVDYGERGISVNKTWVSDFDLYYNYVSTLKNAFKLGYSVDRIDNNGNYDYGNLRWTNATTQNRNTKKLQKNNTSGYRGVTYNKEKRLWDAQITINYKHIYISRHTCRIEAAHAYDNYVLNNNLEHTKNF